MLITRPVLKSRQAANFPPKTKKYGVRHGKLKMNKRQFEIQMVLRIMEIGNISVGNF